MQQVYSIEVIKPETTSMTSQQHGDDVMPSRHCDARQIWRPVTSVDRHRCTFDHVTSRLLAYTQ